MAARKPGTIVLSISSSGRRMDEGEREGGRNSPLSHTVFGLRMWFNGRALS